MLSVCCAPQRGPQQDLHHRQPLLAIQDLKISQSVLQQPTLVLLVFLFGLLVIEQHPVKTCNIILQYGLSLSAWNLLLSALDGARATEWIKYKKPIVPMYFKTCLSKCKRFKVIFPAATSLTSSSSFPSTPSPQTETSVHPRPSDPTAHTPSTHTGIIGRSHSSLSSLFKGNFKIIFKVPYYAKYSVTNFHFRSPLWGRLVFPSIRLAGS